MLAAKVEQQRDFLEKQLAGLGIYAQRKGSRVSKAVRWRANLASACPGSRIQSISRRKTRRLKRTGRGMTPVWMRDEMKGTKLKKNDFLIK